MTARSKLRGQKKEAASSLSICAIESVTAWAGPAFVRWAVREGRRQIYCAPEVLEIINRYNENDGVSKRVHELAYGIVSFLVAKVSLREPRCCALVVTQSRTAQLSKRSQWQRIFELFTNRIRLHLFASQVCPARWRLRARHETVLNAATHANEAFHFACFGFGVPSHCLCSNSSMAGFD